MKSIILFLTVTWLAITAGYVPQYHQEETDKFNAFKKANNRTYNEFEEPLRKAIFVEHLRLIDAHNYQKPAPIQEWGLNSYSDKVLLEIPRGLTWHLLLHDVSDKDNDNDHPQEHHHHKGKKDEYYDDE